MVEQLKKVKSEYEAQLKIESLLNNLGLKKVTNEKHITSELEKQSGIIKEITKGFSCPLCDFDLCMTCAKNIEDAVSYHNDHLKLRNVVHSKYLIQYNDNLISFFKEKITFPFPIDSSISE